MPGSGATANITNTDGTARTITYDYAGAAITLASLTVDLTGNSANADTLSMAANNLSSTFKYIGYSGGGSGGVGIRNQSGGTNTIGTLFVGYNATDVGTYYLSNTATLNASGSEWMGYLGRHFLTRAADQTPWPSYSTLGPGSPARPGPTFRATEPMLLALSIWTMAVVPAFTT